MGWKIRKAPGVARRLVEARARIGEWMATVAGGMYFLDDPHPDDVHVLDVALGLARQPRYNGQFAAHIDFYSVSEHSRLMMDYMRTHDPLEPRGGRMMLEDCLKVLLHDVPEEMFGDMITMLKARFTSWRSFEDMHHDVRFRAFVPEPGAVRIGKRDIKEIDVRIRADERRVLITEPAYTAGGRETLPWLDGEVEPLGVTLDTNLPPVEARAFLETLCHVVETVPARDPRNAPVEGHPLRRHYEDACAFLDRVPVPAPRVPENEAEDDMEMEPS